MARVVRPPILAMIVVAASLVGSCGQGASVGSSITASASPAGMLGVSNGTTIPVTLIVNGTVIEIVGPGDRQEPITATLPPRPWAIEARSPSGRVLASLTVSLTDYISTTSGRAVRVDLSCGILDVWAGPPPTGGPTFIPGSSGDCA